MKEIERVLGFADTLIQHQTGIYCSELQRQILIITIIGEHKTYNQLADE